MLSREMTMGEAIQRVAVSRRDREALVCDDRRLTYGQLLEYIFSLARGLHGLGVGKGDRIAALLPPGPEFVYLFFAAAELGAVIIPLPPRVRRMRLGEVLHDAGPAVLVTSRPIEDGGLDRVTSLRHVILASQGNDRSLCLADLMDAGETTPRPSADISPEDLLALLYTSGTTGKPKGAMHSHRSLIMPVAATMKLRELWIRRPSLKTLGQTAKVLARYRERLLRAIGRPQTLLSTVGWHTITGLMAMLQMLLMGDRLVIMPRFHPREALRLIEQEGVTVLVAVPMAYKVMLGLDGFEGYDTSSLLICGTGAAPCPPELAREIQRRFGCALHIGFGATETGGGIAATSIADSDEQQAETVGQPMPGVEIKIVDEQRRELPPGQVGELACRSEGVMLGYYRAPEMSAAVIDEEGWYYTGDLAVMDAQGYLRIVGRKRDVIIRGGQNIYPGEIEAYLASHPKIREAAVLGVASRIGGESVWAFVLLADEVEMTAQEVVDYCRKELEAYKIPGCVRFVADLPRTETGKPRKFELRAAALQEMKGGEPQ
jgi:acyl-CoA synthetase (AMP-forming)/AMP-acid ligase II